MLAQNVPVKNEKGEEKSPTKKSQPIPKKSYWKRNSLSSKKLIVMKEEEIFCWGKGKDKVLVKNVPLIFQERDKNISAQKSQHVGKNLYQKKNSPLSEISFKQIATPNHTHLSNTAACVSWAYDVTPEEFDEEAVEMTKAADEAYQRAKHLNRYGVLDAWHAAEKRYN